MNIEFWNGQGFGDHNSSTALFGRSLMSPLQPLGCPWSSADLNLHSHAQTFKANTSWTKNKVHIKVCLNESFFFWKLNKGWDRSSSLDIGLVAMCWVSLWSSENFQVEKTVGRWLLPLGYRLLLPFPVGVSWLVLTLSLYFLPSPSLPPSLHLHLHLHHLHLRLWMT